MTPTRYGPESCSWSESTTKVIERIDLAGDLGVGLDLSAFEVDRLKAIFWHLGVLKK